MKIKGARARRVSRFAPEIPQRRFDMKTFVVNTMEFAGMAILGVLCFQWVQMGVEFTALMP